MTSPTPWTAIERGDVILITAPETGEPHVDRVTIATLKTTPPETNQANARLMIAAPELLDALQELSIYAASAFDGYSKDSLAAQLLDAADAAISKATGK